MSLRQNIPLRASTTRARATLKPQFWRRGFAFDWILTAAPTSLAMNDFQESICELTWSSDSEEGIYEDIMSSSSQTNRIARSAMPASTMKTSILTAHWEISSRIPHLELRFCINGAIWNGRRSAGNDLAPLLRNYHTLYLVYL